jgi:hypothetical protein
MNIYSLTPQEVEAALLKETITFAVASVIDMSMLLAKAVAQ